MTKQVIIVAIQLLLLIQWGTSVAQQEYLNEVSFTQNSFERFFFEGKDKNINITVDVTESPEELKYYFKGRIRRGKLDVIILDPHQKRIGGFGLWASSKRAIGSMDEKVLNPIPGKWKIIITSKEAIGQMDIEVLYE